MRSPTFGNGENETEAQDHSIAGGRGSFLCALMGAAMVQSIISATSFLNVDSAWHYTAVGALTLLAAVTFSQARRILAPLGQR